jgi:hypothetical protein
MKKRGGDGSLVKEEIFIFVELGSVRLDRARYLEKFLHTARLGSQVCGTAMESIWICFGCFLKDFYFVLGTRVDRWFDGWMGGMGGCKEGSFLYCIG